MFPDSEIASKYRSARTKTRNVGVLADETQQDIIKAVGDKPFSLATDGSNDKGSEQIYPILLRYFDGSKVVTNVLSITSPKGSSTGREIFSVIDCDLQKFGLSWKNCICFVSDNASVMLGRLNGVAACIKEKNPDVHVLGCPCHLLHIAAKNGAKSLRCPIEEILIDIFYYLQNSSKRLKALESFQRETGTTIAKILKHGPTRWLSLLACINRLLEQWDALKGFFESEKAGKEKHKLEGRLSRINEFFDTKISKAYALFMSFILPKFTNANLLLQREDPVIHLLQRRLHEVATDLLIGFVKPRVVSDCSDIYKIEHHRRSKQKEREELALGEATRAFLGTHKDELSSTAVTHFYEDVRAFYSKSLQYVFDKLPLQQEELQMAEVLDISQRQKVKFSFVRFWLSKFEVLRREVNVEKLENEFSHYQVDSSLKDINTDEKRIDSVWAEIGALKNSDGALKYPNLSKFMKGLLVLPHSNADAERVFSLIRKNKTESRASMSRQLLQDIIIRKAHLISSDTVCHTTCLSDKVLTKVKARGDRE